MITEITLNPKNIDFSPANEAVEVIQNVVTICSTVKGTVPLDREFGVDSDTVDLPVTAARARLSAKFIQAVREFEPRAEVVKVAFRKGNDDEVFPVLTVRIAD